MRELPKNYRIFFDLARSDFQKRYLGSYLGIVWPFAQPTITICIFWFVFGVGFRSTPVEGYPFVLWLIAGIIPWFYFSEALIGGTNSICEYAFLVKKMVFQVSILPMIKIFSALAIHLFFIAATFAVFLFAGQSPNWHWLQVFYYLFASLVLLVGLSYITASLMVFAKDVSQAVNIFIQFGFWITPIFWQLQMVPEKFQPIIKLNPVLYIVDGYRDSLIYNVWFWEKPAMSIYFWTVSLLILLAGVSIYRNTRPHFADVL